MDAFIIYKGKMELDAIVAWCKDHSDEIDLLRRVFVSDAKVGECTRQTTFTDELSLLKAGLEEPDLLCDLAPDARWNDAKAYMAQLVCYVWNNLDAYNSNAKAADYVFRVAREGSRLYADCKYARTLVAKYGKQTSTIIKEAKILHANGTHFKKRKWSGMEKPPTVVQQAMISKKEEMRQIRKEKKNANR